MTAYDRASRLSALEYALLTTRSEVADLLAELRVFGPSLPGASKDVALLRKVRQRLASMVRRYDPVIAREVARCEADDDVIDLGAQIEVLDETSPVCEQEEPTFYLTDPCIDEEGGR